jgi:hypothetical protein
MFPSKHIHHIFMIFEGLSSFVYLYCGILLLSQEAEFSLLDKEFRELSLYGSQTLQIGALQCRGWPIPSDALLSSSFLNGCSLSPGDFIWWQSCWAKVSVSHCFTQSQNTQHTD